MTLGPQKTGFNVRAIFAQYYFALPVDHITLHYFFAWKFYYFACLPILEGDITRIANNDYDENFIISELGKSGGPCDVK